MRLVSLCEYISPSRKLYFPQLYHDNILMQYGGLLSVRNRRVSILNSNPLCGPRRNWAIPAAMLATALIGVANLYGHGIQVIFCNHSYPF